MKQAYYIREDGIVLRVGLDLVEARSSERAIEIINSAAPGSAKDWLVGSILPLLEDKYPGETRRVISSQDNPDIASSSVVRDVLAAL